MTVASPAPGEAVQLVASYPAETVELVGARVVDAGGNTPVAVTDLQAGQSAVDMSGLPGIADAGPVALELDFRVIVATPAMPEVALGWVGRSVSAQESVPAEQARTQPLVRFDRSSNRAFDTGSSVQRHTDWVADWVAGAAAEKSRARAAFRVVLPRL